MDEDPSRNFPKLIVYGCLSPPQILSPNIPNQPHGIRAVESGAISLQSLASGGAVSPRFVGAALFLGFFWESSPPPPSAVCAGAPPTNTTAHACV
jgi:hypothetical protein